LLLVLWRVFKWVDQFIPSKQFLLRFISLLVNFTSFFLFLLRCQLVHRLASPRSLLEVLPLSFDVITLPLVAQVEQFQRVFHQLEFDGLVERAVCAETGSVVHFDYPGIQLVVEHDVEAQDLEAELILNVLWLAAAIQMS
jgi:hypothetical protein